MGDFVIIVVLHRFPTYSIPWKSTSSLILRSRMFKAICIHYILWLKKFMPGSRACDWKIAWLGQL